MKARLYEVWELLCGCKNFIFYTDFFLEILGVLYLVSI